ncbi:murein biosynthesis integral membrane protein MurJ [Rickettsiella endosymbiont of Litargus connexus]|jgi:putative peptidoglycan lipid II flippase|uniref:murein biosynthesis integral membrane protein MurJ n=1 Tax=Rickettsiella endosymbiont of Litargus connexus TaxID=3066237 RepID=UPI0027F8E3D0|nr:murein biosynthesis integral membrane protein MurJ [Gammaproteobacteria bacterium]MCH9754617.1 murein biosynthesis integral membrane protein MurJ [Gammaproteobacteria bacterium]MDD5161628.1 murein biosynthesis integral membrane protein MurJ [Candidatus Rickettsiella isopodorum]MDQ5900179.1 putative peptidoglycan lipid flippase [Pseudomonadota bacterium]
MSKALFKSTSVVASMTLISRILGFVRDMVAARIFGATAAVDAFYIAFKIPNFMRGLFAEGSFSTAFIPTLSEYKQTRSQEEVQKFITYIVGTLGVILLGICILGVLGSKGLVSLFAPGLDPYRFQLAIDMLRITFPYLMLISLTALVGATLNCYGQFWVPAFTPALLNISLIMTAFSVTRFFKVPVEAQAWGVLLAGFLQLGFQLPFLHRLKLLKKPRFKWRDPGVQKVLKLMLPALFGSSIGQISLLLNTIFASFLVAGSVTWLYYSDRLAYFPLGVFGVALMTVILPHLSRQHAAKSPELFASTLNWGLRCNLLIGVPASLTMLILSGPLIVTLFHYGKFTIHDVFMTQRSVIAYSVGLQAFMLIKILAAAFYAQQNIRTPVRIGIIALIANMIFNALLIFPLKHAGLALASSLSAWLNAGLLLWGLQARQVFQWQPGWLKFVLRLLFANSALGLFLYWAAAAIPVWINWGWQQRFSHIFLLGITSVIIYITMLWLGGLRYHDLKAQS